MCSDYVALLIVEMWRTNYTENLRW